MVGKRERERERERERLSVKRLSKNKIFSVAAKLGATELYLYPGKGRSEQTHRDRKSCQINVGRNR